MTVSAETDRNVIQALAHVARLGHYMLASVSTSDDAEKRVLTIKLTGISSGFVQDSLPYDDLTTPLIAHANGRGEVEQIEGLQPGDLAETEAEANAEIEAAELPDAPGGEEPAPDDQPRDPSQPLVGELAAAAKRRR